MVRNAPWYFAAVLLIAVAGFYPSYFSVLPQTDLAHHLHGISATLWLVLLILQSWLIRTGRRSIHRRVGRLSVVLVAAFIVSAAMMMHSMLSSASPFNQHFGVRLVFLDLSSVLYFALAYGLALFHRHSVQRHARYMASTALLVLPPALARFLGHYVPGVESFEQALYGAYLIVEVSVVVLIVQDWRAGHRGTAWPMLLGLLLIQHALVGQVSEFAWWQAVAGVIRSP